jgi:hypothetical protein
MSSGRNNPIAGPSGQAVIETEERSSASGFFKAGIGHLGAWIAGNATRLAVVLLVAGCAVRGFDATRTYLNPDEAAHVIAAQQASWTETYQAAFLLMHPPLLILALHGVMFLGRSVLLLRLSSLLGGAATLWFGFGWMRRILGAVPALAGLGFLTLSPAAISASIEVRQYGLMLGFICAALYAIERAFATGSVGWVALHTLLLAGAMLSNYTAAVVLLCLGCYVLARVLIDPVPRRLLAALILAELSLLSVVGWLYFAHIRPMLRPGTSVAQDYLQHFYFNRGSETLAAFVSRSLIGTFLYASGGRAMALLLVLAFAVGLAAIVAGRTCAPRILALLLLAPFPVAFAVALLRVFPFGGSRHQAYLLPFLAAGVAAAFAGLPRDRAAILLLGAAAIAPVWLVRTVPDNDPHFVPARDMTAAVDYIRHTVPAGTPLFTDDQSRSVFRYYLAQDETHPGRPDKAEWVGGYRLMALSKHVWSFQGDTALAQAQEAARSAGVPGGDPLWIVSTSWMDSPLASRLSCGQPCQGKEFGRVSIIRFAPAAH